MACYSVVSYWWKCRILPCSAIPTCLDFGLNMWEISAWLPPGCSHGVRVHCMCVQISSLCAAVTSASSVYAADPCWMNVTSTLCCHCWMFSLRDALPMQNYLSKVYGSFVWACRSLSGKTCFLPIYFSTWNRWYIMADKMFTSVMPLYLLNIHFYSWIWFSALGWL